MKLYNQGDLDAYLKDDWILELLEKYETDEMRDLRTHQWLKEMSNKRMIYADIYGDLLKTANKNIKVLDVGGGVTSLTKLLAEHTDYTLVDFCAHGGTDHINRLAEQYGFRMIQRDWYDCVFDEKYDIVIANDIFPDVDQRLELFLDRMIPICKELRLLVTYYNKPKFYTTRRVDDTEILTFLSWDGEITALKLKKYLTRFSSDAEKELEKIKTSTESIYRNGRQVAYIYIMYYFAAGFILKNRQKRGETRYMRIVMVNGGPGLGNQAFQYIFARYLEIKTGVPHILDDLSFQRGFLYERQRIVQTGGTPAHYMLGDIFPVHPHLLLSKILAPDVLQEIIDHWLGRNGRIKKDIMSILNEAGMEMLLVDEGGLYRHDFPQYQGGRCSAPMNGFAPEAAKLKGNLYFYGYWINGNWFREIKNSILQELQFPPLPGGINRAYEREMVSDRSVAVHIRRTDFMDVGWLLNPQFYVAALAKFREIIDNPEFFVFSDDLPYVKEHLEDYGFLPSDSYTFIEGNEGEQNYIDMQLMSLCRGMVISNSSFSYLAALLNRRPDKLVANPTQREIF